MGSKIKSQDSSIAAQRFCLDDFVSRSHNLGGKKFQQLIVSVVVIGGVANSCFRCHLGCGVVNRRAVSTTLLFGPAGVVLCLLETALLCESHNGQITTTR